MSFGGAEFPPATEHAAAILAGPWPSQSIMGWASYADEQQAAAEQLFAAAMDQFDIKQLLFGQSGAFIDAAMRVVCRREDILFERISAYQFLSNQARWVAREPPTSPAT